MLVEAGVEDHVKTLEVLVTGRRLLRPDLHNLSSSLTDLRVPRFSSTDSHHGRSCLDFYCGISGHGRRPPASLCRPGLLNGPQEARNASMTSRTKSLIPLPTETRLDFPVMFAPFCKGYQNMVLLIDAESLKA